MRKTLIAAAALALVSPAAAHDPIFTPDMDEEILRAIPAPEVIEEATYGIDRVLGAVLDVPIGPLMDAVDPYRRHARRGETVRDMAGRDDPYFEDRIRYDLYAATGQMNAMMDALAVITPVLRRSLEDVERSVRAATRDVPRRDRRYDPYER